MALFVDSADVNEVREAIETGFVAGVTTNPILIARAGRPAYETIVELCSISPGPVFHQLASRAPEAMETEARRFLGISPEQIVLKIPCTLEALKVAARLSSHARCAITGVFSPAQAYLAAEARARYVIPYVNRATRQMGDGVSLVRALAEVVAASGRDAEVLAASLKTPDEVVAAITAGARHVTVPLNLIRQMAEHPLSLAAIEEFARA